MIGMAKWGAISAGTVTVTFFLANADFIKGYARDLDRGTQYGLIFLALATVPTSIVVAGIVGAVRPGYRWRKVDLRESVAVGVMGSGLGLRVRL